MSAELDDIEARIEKGVTWLTEHDPTGAFHLWFESGISPHSTMPAQTPERKEEYKAYHKNRLLFDALWQKMERLERAEKAKEAVTT